jgi:hypothetical protein
MKKLFANIQKIYGVGLIGDDASSVGSDATKKGGAVS